MPLGASALMRIGTWNLAGRWSEAHKRLLIDEDCDVWLLTETSERLELDGYSKHQTEACMAPRRRWAGILSRVPLTSYDDPHPATAFASAGKLAFCCSVLPWRSCGQRQPWIAAQHADKTSATLDDLLKKLPATGLIWGGDWNHALSGPEWVGSKGGRKHLLAAVASLALQVPTAPLKHRLPDLLAIDHIAVPTGTKVVSAGRVIASAEEKRLSDHDAYVIEIA